MAITYRFILLGLLSLILVASTKPTIEASPDLTPSQIQKYHACKDMLFKPYPKKVNPKEWKNCMAG
tara:strand:- start:28 stop:225 length:198 start_codon:yes stop_codon:yes gene_type:complete